MKRFLIYVIVLIGVLFIGFTTYYFVQNKESIYLKYGMDSMLQYNIGETFELNDVLVHTQADKGTKVEVSSDNTEILSYTPETLTFQARKGGLAKVVITTNNPNFDRFTFSVHVGDGTPNNPYFIKTATQLASIGTGDWGLNNSYQVVNNIDLNTPETSEWQPIGSAPFTGTFDGGNNAIYNLNITNSTENAGLFNSIGEAGRVENVKFVDVNIVGSFSNAGTVAGINNGNVGLIYIQNATISNTNTSGNTGGLVGQAQYINSRPEIYMSVVENINLNATNYVGGIAGKTVGTITTDCKAIINTITTDETSKLGGIIGSNESYNDGTKYRHSMLKNCFSILSQNSLTSNVGAILGQDVDSTNEYDLTNIYENNYYNALNISGFAGNVDKNGVVMKRTIEELYERSSYTNWNFNNIWTIEEGSSFATIDFNNTYLGTSIYDPGNVITNKEELTTALNMLIANPSSDATIEVNFSEDTIYTMQDLDPSLTTWEPIGSEETPFMGKFIVTGKSLTFKDFIIQNKKYAGFFGFADGDAEINGVNFENFHIYNSSDFVSDYTGTIVAYGATARISNCTVIGLDISTGNTIGGAVGYIGNGYIDNITIQDSATENYTNKINYTKPVTGTVGGVVGISEKATIENVKTLIMSSTIQMYLNTTANLTVGGIVAINNNMVSNLYNEAIVITEEISGNLIAGGVVGTNRGKIENSCLNVTLALRDVNNNSYAGGIVGANEQNAEVKTSYVENISIKGNYIGGIAGTNAGTITECYSSGEILGKFIGGLVSISNGIVNNCFTTATLTGQYEDGVVAGLAYRIDAGTFEYCFSSATITGKGDLFAETYSPFRLTFLSKLAGRVLNVNYGEVKNCLIVNYGESKRQSTSDTVLGDILNFIPTLFTGGKYAGWIDCSDEDCKGTSGFKAFIDNKFSNTIWDFESFENVYPTLKNIEKIVIE